jgi:hypothetical protein
VSCSRSILLALATVVAAAPLGAQEKPTEAMVRAIAGTWQIDTARSELPPAGLAALLNQGQRPAAAPRPDTAAAPAAAPAAGGRRGGGGGGGGGRGLGPRQMGDGNLRVLMTEIRVPRTLVLNVTDATAITKDVAGYETTWKLDGKKHPVAQMEGGVVEFLGEWHGKSLLLEKSIPGGGGVRREFKPLGENELEVKLTVNVGKKMEQKLVYTRMP